MAELTLTKTRFSGGTWEGIISGAGSEAPTIVVTHLTQAIDGVTVEQGASDGEYTLTIQIASSMISDGVQTFIITDADSDTRIGSFEILAGDALADDIRAEMNLLREELDMLKRAFRRHCVETA